MLQAVRLALAIYGAYNSLSGRKTTVGQIAAAAAIGCAIGALITIIGPFVAPLFGEAFTGVALLGARLLAAWGARVRRPLEGLPTFVERDHAFNFKPALREPRGRTSLAFGTLQIEVSVETGRLLYVWGYAPVSGWRRDRVVTPEIVAGSVQVMDMQLIRGVSVGVVKDPIKVFDPETGWFCASVPALQNSDRTVNGIEFATDTIAVVHGDELMAVMVRPANWRDLASRVRSPT
jgi:hypothetical protein